MPWNPIRDDPDFFCENCQAWQPEAAELREAMRIRDGVGWCRVLDQPRVAVSLCGRYRVIPQSQR